MPLQVVLVIRSQGTTTSWVSFVFHPDGGATGRKWSGTVGQCGGTQGGRGGGVVGRRKGHDKMTVR